MKQVPEDANPYRNIEAVYYDFLGPTGGYVLRWKHGTYPPVDERKLYLETCLGAKMEHVRR